MVQLSPQAETALSVASFYIKNKVPALASMAFFPRRIITEPGEVGGVVLTSRAQCLIDPQWLEGIIASANSPTIAAMQVGGAMLHNLFHLILRHDKRAVQLGLTDAQLKTWNLACDISINSKLAAANICLPDGYIKADTFGYPGDLLPEEYYVRLLNDRPEFLDEKYAKASPQNGDSLANGLCGSASGREHHIEKDHPADNDTATSSEVGQVSRDVIKAMQEDAKNRGTVAAGFARELDFVEKPPKVDWREHLSQLVRESVAARKGSYDTTYTYTNKKQAGLGFGPGCPRLTGTEEFEPSIAVILDTSGSMGQTDFQRAFPEIQGILKQVGGKIKFLTCDAEVHDVVVTDDIEEIKANIHGGGGTDMGPALQRCVEMKDRPHVVICLTDGYIGDPGPERDEFKVIWCLTQDCKEYVKKFGDIVECWDEKLPGQ